MYIFFLLKLFNFNLQTESSIEFSMQFYQQMYNQKLSRSIVSNYSSTNYLDDSISYHPKSYNQSLRKNQIHLKTFALQSDSFMLEKMYLERLLAEKKIDRQKVNMMLQQSKSQNRKRSNSHAQNKKQKNDNSSLYSKDRQSNRQKLESKQVEKRPQSANAKNGVSSEVIGLSSKTFQNLQVKNNADWITDNNQHIQSSEPKIDEKNLQQSQPYIQQLEQQIKSLRLQIEQKDKTIVNLEGMVKKINKISNTINQEDGKKKQQIQQNVEKQLVQSNNLSSNQLSTKIKLKKCGQFLISVSKVEEEKFQTKQSFMETTADMKKFNIENQQLKQTMFMSVNNTESIEEQQLSQCNPSAMSNLQPIQAKILQKTSRQQSMTQSIIFNPRDSENSQVDLTLSASLVVSPPIKSKKINKKNTGNDSLGFSFDNFQLNQPSQKMNNTTKEQEEEFTLSVSKNLGLDPEKRLTKSENEEIDIKFEQDSQILQKN